MSNNLRGKKIAITGGARGIGAATARLLAQRGAAVSVGDIDAALAAETAASISADTGAQVVSAGLDVTDSASFEKFLGQASDDLGGLDVLINNAGIMPTGEFLSETDTVTERQIDINIRGVLTGTKLAGRIFALRGRGHIVNIASVAGVIGAPGVATYCATKHAVLGLGMSLHQELEPKGVKVSTICPSFVKTELISGLSPNWLMRQIGLIEPGDVAKAIADAIATGQGGTRFVPWIGGTVLKSLLPLPEGLFNTVGSLFGMRHVTLESNEKERAAYRARAESAPVKAGRS